MNEGRSCIGLPGQGSRSGLHTRGLNHGQCRLLAPKACGWNGGGEGGFLQGTAMEAPVPGPFSQACRWPCAPCGFTVFPLRTSLSLIPPS